MVPDVERMLTEKTGGAIVNRNSFAGADQLFFSKEPLQTLEDFQGKKIRTYAAALSSIIEGPGAKALFIPPAPTTWRCRTATSTLAPPVPCWPSAAGIMKLPVTWPAR